MQPPSSFISDFIKHRKNITTTIPYKHTHTRTHILPQPEETPFALSFLIKESIPTLFSLLFSKFLISFLRWWSESAFKKRAQHEVTQWHDDVLYFIPCSLAVTKYRVSGFLAITMNRADIATELSAIAAGSLVMKQF